MVKTDCTCKSEENCKDGISIGSNFPKSVWLIAFWSLFMGITTTMIYSQLGMFLKHELHASALNIALLDGFVEFLSNITRIFAGVISDFMMNRKNILLFGCLFSILVKPFFVIANSVYMVFFAQSLDRISNGIQASPRDALIADISNPKQISASYGLTRSLKTVGAFLGTITAVSLLKCYDGQYRTMFMFAFIPAILSVLLLIKIKEPKSSAPKTDSTSKKKYQNPFNKKAIKSLNIDFWKLMAFGLLFELSHFSDALLTVRANDFLDPIHASTATIAMNIGQLLCAYPIGVLADKYGKKTFICVCILLMLLSNTLLLVAWSGVPVFIGAFFWGGQMSSVVGLFLSLIRESVDEHLRGTAIGIYYTLVGLGYIVASWAAGWLWSHLGCKYAFIYSISICVISLLLSKTMIKEKSVEKTA